MLGRGSEVAEVAGLVAQPQGFVPVPQGPYMQQAGGMQPMYYPPSMGPAPQVYPAMIPVYNGVYPHSSLQPNAPPFVRPPAHFKVTRLSLHVVSPSRSGCLPGKGTIFAS